MKAEREREKGRDRKKHNEQLNVQYVLLSIGLFVALFGIRAWTLKCITLRPTRKWDQSQSINFSSECAE